MVICMNGFQNFEQPCMNSCRIPSCVMQITDTLISAVYQNCYFELDHKIFSLTRYFRFFPSKTGVQTSVASRLAL
jgi:hypothetical protein